MEKENHHLYFVTRCRYEFCWKVQKFSSFRGTLESEAINFEPVCSSMYKIILSSEDGKKLKLGIQRLDRNTHVVQLKVHFVLRNSKETPVIGKLWFEHFTWVDDIKYYPECLRKPTTERNNKFRLRPDDFLTIDGYITPFCCLQRTRSGLEEVDQLQKYLGSLLSDYQYADIKLLAKEDSVLAHQFILAVRSPFFEKLMSTDKQVVDSKCVKFESDKVVLLAVLKFIYTGMLEELDAQQTLACYGVARDCDMLDLLDASRDRLCSLLSESNVCKILIEAHGFKDRILTEIAARFLCFNFLSVPKEEWKKFIESKSDIVPDIMIRIHSDNYSK